MLLWVAGWFSELTTSKQTPRRTPPPLLLVGWRFRSITLKLEHVLKTSGIFPKFARVARLGGGTLRLTTTTTLHLTLRHSSSRRGARGGTAWATGVRQRSAAQPSPFVEGEHRPSSPIQGTRTFRRETLNESSAAVI
jgi:hypothetical protein